MDRKNHTLKDLVVAVLARRGGLTVVEHRVLALELDGLSDRGIAEMLGISHWTASQHVKAVHGKLACHGRAELFAAVLHTAERVWCEARAPRACAGESEPIPERSAPRNAR